MEKKLITKNDISEYFEVGKNIEESRFESAIMTAQQNDLEPVIGGALYRDLCENTDSVNNVKLLQGIEYEINGATIYYRGIRAQLSCYAYARFIKKAENMPTRAGLKQKDTVNSTPVEISVENQMIRDAYSRARKFESDTKQYLEQNVDDYPLYNQFQGQVRPNKGAFRMERVY